PHEEARPQLRGCGEQVMIELTEQQLQELQNSEPRIRDPQTGEVYVLLRAEVYERLKGMLGDEDWTEDAYRAAMEVFARDGWNDPRMNVYDELDPRPDTHVPSSPLPASHPRGPNPGLQLDRP